MDTQDIYIIRQIYETGSLTKAASALYISPQALSKRIQKIEKELSVDLFERTSSGMIPTAEGHRFYKGSKSFYNEMMDFFDSFRSPAQKPYTRISVASSLGVAALLTPEKIHQFRDQHPEIELQIREYPDKQVDNLVLDGKVDFGFAIAPVSQSDFTSVTLKMLPFCVLTHKGSWLAGKKKISFEDLRDIPIALENQDFKVYHLITSSCISHGIQPNIYFETLELNLAHSLAMQNECVAISLLSDRFLKGIEDLEIKQFRNPLYWQILAIKKAGEPFTQEESILIDYITEALSENKDDN